MYALPWCACDRSMRDSGIQYSGPLMDIRRTFTAFGRIQWELSKCIVQTAWGSQNGLDWRIAAHNTRAEHDPLIVLHPLSEAYGFQLT